MSEASLEYGRSTTARRASMLYLGGGLGIAACTITLVIFLAALFGMSAVYMLSIVPLALGIAGLFLSVGGPILQKQIHVDDPAVFASIFVSVLGVVGGIILIWMWRMA